MPTLHTSIPDTVLPTALAEPNRIVTRYESYTLIPRLGPLTYAYIRRDAWRRLWHFHLTLKLLDKLAVHKKVWKTVPVLSAVKLTAIANVGRAGVEVSAESLSSIRKSGAAGRAQVAPTMLLRSFRRLPGESVSLLSGTAPVVAPRLTILDTAEAESAQGILELMKERNPVVDRLADVGKLLDKDGAVRAELLALDTKGRLDVLLDAMSSPEGQPRKLLVAVSKNAVQNALSVKDGMFGELGRLIKDDAGLRNKVIGAVAEMLHDFGALSGLSSLDDAAIVDSREWAFLRRERVELLLQTPEYRGPVGINSVAPNSELTISDTQTTATQTFDIAASRRAQRSGSNMLIANQIKEKLGTLYDYGSNLGQTMSEQGYERDNTRGEKRSIVEQTLSEVSETNASKTISISSMSATSLREYRTEGKDTSFATTEVSFEAFCPVKVTHYLEEIGAVWCPRIKNPYGTLRQTISDFEDQVRGEYIAENYVVDPAEPLPTYEGIERVSVNTKKVTDDTVDDDPDGTIYEDTVTIRLSEAERSQNYFLSSDVQCEFKQDDSWWSNAFDSDQYEVLDPQVLEHVENSHITINARFKVLDEPNGPNPDSIWLSVSVTKYKYTSAYLEQLKEYRNTVQALNPARRTAVEAQAKRYARLKREELVQRYADDPGELRDYTFIALMRQMFGDMGGDWSYYHGIIKTCIDWDRAKIEPEPAAPEDLAADGLSPFHFLNVNAVRFFLPIHQGSEDAFFEAVSNTLDANWKQLFADVQSYIDRQRAIVKAMTERMNAADRKALTLDEYDSELVLGRHLEAVLSRTTFLES